MNTILVTGGNRGIGFEICRQLDELGHNIILGSRDYEKGNVAAKSLSKNVVVKQLDVTNEKSIQNLFEFVKINFGKLDVLINNAGIGARKLTNENSALAKAKNFLETNIYGIREINKIIIPKLRKAGLVTNFEGAENISIASAKLLMETNFYGPGE